MFQLGAETEDSNLWLETFNGTSISTFEFTIKCSTGNSPAWINGLQNDDFLDVIFYRRYQEGSFSVACQFPKLQQKQRGNQRS